MRHQVVGVNIAESSFSLLISWLYKTKSVHARLTLPDKNEVSGSSTAIMYPKTGPFKFVD